MLSRFMQEPAAEKLVPSVTEARAPGPDPAPDPVQPSWTTILVQAVRTLNLTG